MAQIINKDQIKKVIPSIDLLPIIEEGFQLYSEGKTVVPPVGELLFEKPPGEVHIKYGYIKDDDFYVIKIASGFYENTQLNISASQGLMLVFDQKTGVLKAVLLDEGLLTDIRTAVAGAIAAKYLAPKNIHQIGIVGTGIQARLQLEYLKKITDCRRVLVWARNEMNGQKMIDEFLAKGYNISFTLDASKVASSSNLIVTTTPSKTPLILAENIQAGTHITAMGSDTSDKIELDPIILSKADIVVVDSLPQSESRGEVFQTVKTDLLDRANVIELGKLISNPSLQRQNENQITIADLTGVAVQDIQIAKAVFKKILNET